MNQITLWMKVLRALSYEDKNGEEKLANIEAVYYMSSSAWNQYREREILIYDIPQDKFNLEKYQKSLMLLRANRS